MQEVSDHEAVAGAIVAKATAATEPRKRGNKKGGPRPSVARPFPGIADDDVLLTSHEVGIFFGGPGRPLDLATIYRGAAKGIYPLPVQIGPRSVRWLRSECRTARQRFIDARGKPPEPKASSDAGAQQAGEAR
jgi:Prophage CP4-57 regulatory protein (AlpA)